MFGIGSIAATAFTQAIVFFQGLVLSILGSLLSWAVGGLAYFLTYQANFFKNIVVVNETWRVMRDFSNMFFILMLIVISFATIFQIKNYNWKGLMARLIVIALLINFSLVICNYAIRASHIVSNVMLASIGGDEKSIADNLGAALQMNKLVGDGQKNVNNSASSISSVGDNGNLGRTAFDAILSTIMSIVVVFIALLAIVSAFAFSLVRIPVLWALMIISPLAWTASILPGTKKMYDMWFKEFVGWVVFLPAYLFTLFLSLIILKARNSISAVVQAAPKAGTDAFGGFFGFAFQDLFYYVICILAIVYGLKFAKDISFGGSASAGKFFNDKISSKVNQWGRDRTYVTAVKKGWEEKQKEYKDKGYGFGKFRVGGERGEKLREASVASVFGTKGRGERARVGQGFSAQDIETEKKKFEAQQLNKAQVAEAIKSGRLFGTVSLNESQRAALAVIRAENGWVESGRAGRDEVMNTINAMGGSGSKAAQDYLGKLDSKDFQDMFVSPAEKLAFADSLRGNPAMAELRKKLLSNAAKNREIMDTILIGEISKLYINDAADIQDKIATELQKNVTENIFKDKDARAKALASGGYTKEINKMIAKEMKEKGEISKLVDFENAYNALDGKDARDGRELVGSIKKPLLQAELEWRIDNAIPITAPTASFNATQKAGYKAVLNKEVVIKKATPKVLAESSKDLWNEADFISVLEDHILDREGMEPTKPAKVSGKGKKIKEVPGAGKKYFLSLEKAVGVDKDKKPILDALKAKLKASGAIPF